MGDADADPSHELKQLTFVLVTFPFKGPGCVMVTVFVAVQPLASVTVTV